AGDQPQGIWRGRRPRISGRSGQRAGRSDQCPGKLRHAGHNDGPMIQGSHASLLSGAEFTLAGKWRWLPWYPVAVMIGITAFLVWLTRDVETGWLVPLVVSPGFLLAIII